VPKSPLTRFERLALPHLPAAYNLAFWLVRSRPDAEDVVQDAYVRALRAFEAFRGDNIRAWLLAIVRNAAYRWLSERRRASNVVSLDEAFAASAEDAAGRLEPASAEPNAEEQLIRAGEREVVLEALAALPPIFREVIVLREIEGLSYRDLAAVVGAPIGTIMSRLSRGRELLRKALPSLTAKDEPNAL
jgi:RNA polymerase sigma-70 factor (ECF subfamily)